MARSILPALLTLVVVQPFASAQTLREQATFKGHTFNVNKTALSPDGKIFASGGGNSNGGELKFWDAATGKELAALRAPSSLDTLDFNSDGTLLAAGTYATVGVWNVQTHKKIADLFIKSGIRSVSFSEDGKKVGVIGSDEIKIWELATGKELVCLKHLTRFYAADRGKTFSKDLSVVAVTDYQEIDLRETGDGKLRTALSEHKGQVGFTAFSVDGKSILAASSRHKERYDGSAFRWLGDLKIWDVATGKERIEFKGPFGRIEYAALSPDGKTIALLDAPTLHAEPDFKLLDVASGRQIVVAPPFGHAFTSFAFTANNKLFVVGTPDDKLLKMWEVSLPKGK